MSSEDIVSTLEAMRLQEASYQCRGYLSSNSLMQRLKRMNAGTGIAPPADAECRFKMAEWCCQVVDFCKFNRETVAIAMSYLDRYLSTQGVRSPALDDRKVFQLAAMTCLYTAIKIHEPEAMEPRIISQLSRGGYTEEQVTDMELEILNAIQWRMNPPTAFSFIHNLLALLPEGSMSPSDRDTVYELAKCQTELAIHEYSLVTVDASIVATSSIMNALGTVKCANITEIKMILAKVLSIDVESKLVTATQDKLYQFVTNVSSTGPSATQLNPTSSVSKRFISQRGSVHGSPCSVVTSKTSDKKDGSCLGR
jgi:hypothetical protein